MTQQKTLPNVYQRILLIMADLDYIQKGDAKVNGMYRFVSHDQVTAAIHPLLVKHGLVLLPTVIECSQEIDAANPKQCKTTIKIQVSIINSDSPTECIIVHSYGQGIDNADKGIGKAYSYAYKYALLKTFNLETGDDPDNDAKTKFTPETAEQGKKKLQEFVISIGLSDEEQVWVSNFIAGYANHFKKTIAQSLSDYKDLDKLKRDVLGWKEKQLRLAKAA